MAMTAKCSDDNYDPSREQVMTLDPNVYSKMDRNSIRNVLAGLHKEKLSDDEHACLQLIREEEKLTHDVYDKLYFFWGRPIFHHNSDNEQTPLNAVFLLLEKYDLEDPTYQKDYGQLANAAIQHLNDSFRERGKTSMVETLVVGAAIEELDFGDLQIQLDDAVDPNIFDWSIKTFKEGQEISQETL